MRITNSDVICQISYAKIQGDIVFCSAYSHELPRYGVKVGLTNFSSAYCTGLLCARRALAKLGLDKQYEGKINPDGGFYIVEAGEDSPRPFKVYLDVGLARTTTGSRIFGALKGAVDGGLYIPHSDSRFPGYSSESKKVDSKVLRGYIFGQHVANYMTLLQDEDSESFKKQFSKYVELGITPDSIEGIYSKAHDLIRSDPSPKLTEKDSNIASKSIKYKVPRLSLEERKASVASKMASFHASV